MRLHLVRHGTSDPERRSTGTRRPRRVIAVLTAVTDPVTDTLTDQVVVPVASTTLDGSGTSDCSADESVAVRRITTSSLALSAAELAERVGHPASLPRLTQIGRAHV